MMLAGQIFKQWNENGGAFVPTFDTPSQIPSGVDLGPAISVAGETWYWSTTRNRYIPGEMVSKATYTDLTTLATQMGLGNDAASIGINVWLVNSLAPGGMTLMYWTGTMWVPVDGQLLYQAIGTLLDMTAAALSIGAWNEVWQSPILPDWMFYGWTISARAVAYFTDVSSTAPIKFRLCPRSAAYTSGDEYSALIGYNSAATSYNRGINSARYSASLSGSNMTAAAVLIAGTPYRTFPYYESGTMRMRAELFPGAATNTCKLRDIELWSGG